MRVIFALLASGLIAAAPTAASSSDDDFELWLNPSVGWGYDEDTAFELETAQRFRDLDKGRVDTYFARLWLHQDVHENVTLSGAAERRFNVPSFDETRFIQQVTTRHGILRTRLRLEQRLVDQADRMGLRVRPRVGVAIPLNDESRWAFKTDAELFFTLRSNNIGGDDGLTGLRTQTGVSYEVNDRLSLSLAYLRDQDIEDDQPDTVGHAPLIGVEFSF